MDIFEYQARNIFEHYGVPVPPAAVTETAQEAEDAARGFFEAGHSAVVVKAQVKTGGRGKAGGVKVARSVAEAREAAESILGMDIKGHTVHRVMVVPAADIASEYYVSLLLDRSTRSYLAMASVEGGMEIEELAVTRPEALAQISIDPLRGIDHEVAWSIVNAAGFPEDVASSVAFILEKLWAVYQGEDALLVEINPLVRTGDGKILALDGKVSLDDNADFRHPEHAVLDDHRDDDPLESRAREKGLGYVKLDGQVGIIGNGAGLVMSTLDVVAYAGEKWGVSPANFLDIGGGASAEVMAAGLDIVLSDPQVRSVFVNVFGGITACDAVANGILAALEILKEAPDSASKPLVVRLDGNNVLEGRRILAEAAHPMITVVDTMDDAAARAAELAHLPQSAYSSQGA